MVKERKSTAPSVKTKVATEAGGEQVVADSAALEKLLEGLKWLKNCISDTVFNMNRTRSLSECAQVLAEAWEGSTPVDSCEKCETCTALSDFDMVRRLLVTVTDDIVRYLAISVDHTTIIDDAISRAVGSVKK